MLLLKVGAENCGARELEIITISVTPEKRLNQIIRWFIIQWNLKRRCSLVWFPFFQIRQISFYDKQTGIVGTRETIWATHKVVRVCMCACASVLGVGLGGTGQAYHKYAGRGLSNRGKMWAPLWFLLPVLMQLPTLKTLRPVIAVKCREQQSWKELGERDVSGGCALVVLLRLRVVVALLKKRMRSKDAGRACGLVGPFAA